jgi:hypothetical protein
MRPDKSKSNAPLIEQIFETMFTTLGTKEEYNDPIINRLRQLARDGKFTGESRSVNDIKSAISDRLTDKANDEKSVYVKVE